MNSSVLRSLGAAVFAVMALASFPAAGQSCDCTHQGASVDCPAHLPKGSRSVQFVSGGTMWATPDGKNVFVPQSNFACHSLPSAATSDHPSGAQQGQSGKSGKDYRSQLLLGLLGNELEHKQHSANSLKEDSTLVCYRHVRATVIDGNGVTHHGSLYDQLGKALGIDNARLKPAGNCANCSAPAYDCGGTFYDRDGKPTHLPAFRSDATSDTDLKKWQADVQSFYLDAYVDRHGTRLSPGKAALCREWAVVSSQARPDPSLLQELDALQQIGAEKMVGQDRQWLTSILSAGTAKGCFVPPSLPQNDEESWFVPESSARSFLKGFHNCSQPDTNMVGGCPHPFDAPNGMGNFVNDHFLLDADTTQGVKGSIFVGDEAPPCAIDCYRPADRSTSSTGSGKADTDCVAAINACLQACESSNAALSKRCIELGGSPTGAMCTANADKCSCTQSAPDCKKN